MLLHHVQRQFSPQQGVRHNGQHFAIFISHDDILPQLVVVRQALNSVVTAPIAATYLSPSGRSRDELAQVDLKLHELLEEKIGAGGRSWGEALLEVAGTVVNPEIICESGRVAEN